MLSLKYVLQLETNLKKVYTSQDVKQATYDNLRQATTTRSGAIRQTIALSSNPPPLATIPPVVSIIAPVATPPIPIQTRQYNTLKSALKNSITRMPYNLMDNPLYELLKANKHKDKGWIFDKLPDEIYNSKKKQIDGNTKLLYLTMVLLFARMESNGGKLSGWEGIILRAFDVSTKYMARSFDLFIDRDFNYKRKEQRDTGTNLFCDKSKCRQIFIALG